MDQQIGELGISIVSFTESLLQKINLTGDYLVVIRTLTILIGAVLVCAFLWWVTRKILITIIYKLADKSKTMWDDYLVENKFFAAIANLVPLLFIDTLVITVFVDYPKIGAFFMKASDVAIVFVVLIGVLRFLTTFQQILSEKERLKDKPIQSYFQLIKIIISGFMIILGLSIATGQSPIYFLTSLGAMTAIILLIFKDTILGFVGSIQLAANDMVRIGDWITMEKYGADGDVIEITLATVKVQNFDKTITTIPTYSFISDSFKNWRGMEQSDGRRLKRALNIEINSIQFCTPELLEKLRKIDFLKEHISLKENDIKKFNRENSISKDYLLNGRNQTNIGLYRYYIEEYLKQHPRINSNMTLMVRQLAPTSMGVPIEVYCFTKAKEWEIYEGVLADVFDHIFAATSYFDLVVFERPSGKDLRSIILE
jgi:miniconductance mechanosensitive channel